MTPEQTINLKEGDIVYIVVRSNEYSLNNPFLRTCGSHSTGYKKPLGVFETKVAKIKEYSNDGSYHISGELDITPYKQLLWEGHYDGIPDGKKIYEYGEYYTSLNFWGNFKNLFGDYGPGNIFLAKEEADEYYKKELKKFNRNMKSYLTKLNSEIEYANRNIKEAQEQVDHFKKYCKYE